MGSGGAHRRARGRRGHAHHGSRCGAAQGGRSEIGSPACPPDAVEADLAILCRSCGLCCDGSLFGRVNLEPEEVDRARRRGLHVLPSDKGFEQPCSALVAGEPGRGEQGRAERRCAVYGERPLACRRFACRLYDRHLRDGGPVAARLAVVERVRRLAASLEASGRSPADFEAARSSTAAGSPIDADIARAMPDYLELTRMLDEDFARAG